MQKIDIMNPDMEALGQMPRELLLEVLAYVLTKAQGFQRSLDYFVRKFRHNTSERHPEIDPLQLLLFDQEQLAALTLAGEPDREGTPADDPGKKDVPARPRKKHGRTNLKETGLPVVIKELYPEGVLDEGGNLKPGWKVIGFEDTDKLSIKPAELFIQRTRRYKVVFDPSAVAVDCQGQEAGAEAGANNGTEPETATPEGGGAPAEEEGTDIRIAELPADLDDRVLLSSQMIAWVMDQKFHFYLTYYRMEELTQGLGFKVPHSTLISNFQAGIHRIRPLYCLLVDSILDSPYIQCDEVSHPVIDSAAHKSRPEWIFSIRDILTGWHALVYEDDGSKSADTAWHVLRADKARLRGDRRVLHTDGGTAYAYFDQPGAPFVHANCWDHHRRCWERALQYDRKNAGEAILRIRKIFKVEDEAAKTCHSAEEVRLLRQEKALPMVNDFTSWCKELQPKVLPKSPTGLAISYFFEHEKGLRVYLDDGKVPISTIKLEQDHRPVATGRKNALFSQNHESMEENCIGYTMVQLARINGANPVVWLEDILTWTPRYEEEGRDLKELLFPHWFELPRVKEMERKGVLIRLSTLKDVTRG